MLRAGSRRLAGASDEHCRGMFEIAADFREETCAKRAVDGAVITGQGYAHHPRDLRRAVDGMHALAKNGLRYPIPPYGVQMDPSAGMGRSYSAKS